MKAAFLIISYLFCVSAFAQKALIKIDATYLETKGHYSKEECSPVNSQDSYIEIRCVNMNAGWITYSGNVSEVLFGEIDEKQITFTWDLHMKLSKDALKGLILLVEPIKEEKFRKFSNADYVVLDSGLKLNSICFSQSLKKSFGSKYELRLEHDHIFSDKEFQKDSEKMACYYEDEIVK